MKLQLIIVFIVLLLVVRTGYAQETPFDPCMNEFTVTKAQLVAGSLDWIRIGERMRACKAFVVKSDSAYLFQKAFNDTLQANYDSLVVELKRGQAWRDSLVVVQDSFITLQSNVINKYDRLLVESNQLILDANANTTKALKQISLLKWVSIGGIVIGVGGLLVALVAN